MKSALEEYMQQEIDRLKEENRALSDSLNSLVKCQEENEHLKSAIERLASMEAFEFCCVIDKSMIGQELRARIAFAQKALNVTGEPRRD